MKKDNHKQIDIDALIDEVANNSNMPLDSSKAAIFEQRLFNDKNLEQIAKSNEHQRTETLRWHFSKSVIFGYYGCAL